MNKVNSCFIRLGIVAMALIIMRCSTKEDKYDASGTFEAVETIVSAEASGVLKAFNVEEGQVVKEGEQIGYIDSVQLYLRKKQLQAQIRAVVARTPNVSKQLSALYAQLDHARNEQQRVARLLKADAATPKQYDDATAQVAVIERQIEGQQSTLSVTKNSIGEDVLPLQVQIEQLNDQLYRCRIVNPVAGTVLVKYAEAFEMTNPGKALYKVADLSTLVLRTYVTGEQLPAIKIAQAVKVFTDAADNQSHESEGKIEWISDKAEFTPKTIQTKDERANLVYAVKIRVPNDGRLKIGMYGEVKFQPSH
ncbi:HlyD family efflux transporter periplasmic adaptor subunit [Chryseolinea sp. T2]|uniref:HlyD family secretion protein n=1 Tax=Chryseolinea sp. T2 TaxID=3129255 RepID=UPI003078056C